MASENPPQPSSGPACLALTFLLLGLGYAFPISLWPVAADHLAVKGPATLNLYALTAWMGLAHFVYAVQGQAASLRRRSGVPAVWGFAAFLIGLWGLSFGFRTLLGPSLFDGVVWVYFIAHFLKAELFFDRRAFGDRAATSFDFLFPVAAFALFSAALIGREWFLGRELLLLGLALGLAGIPLVSGGWRRLFDPRRSTHFVLAMFLLGEALVWGNYARYMTANFADGVYGFHVAAASFFHYARAYALPLSHPHAGWFLSLAGILAVNLVVIAAGWWTGHALPSDTLNVVWDPRFFTVWVLWHLLTSDIAPRFWKPAPRPVLSATG